MRSPSGTSAEPARLLLSGAVEAVEGSDLDLLVEMEPGRNLLDLVAIKQDLEELLGCKVDVVTEAAVSPYLRELVLNETIHL